MRNNSQINLANNTFLILSFLYIYFSEICNLNFLFYVAEISRVRANLFQIHGYLREPLDLPDGVGPPVTLTDKVYVPVKDYPEVSKVFQKAGGGSK